MTTANVNKTINASADAVWDHLGKFDGLTPGGPIEAVAYEGSGVGMVRTLTMNGANVVERLDVHDAASRTFAYTIVNDDSPLPFTGYSAKVVISDNGDNSCTVDWTGTFEVKNATEAEAVATATGIYAGAIKGARLALEPK